MIEGTTIDLRRLGYRPDFQAGALLLHLGPLTGRSGPRVRRSVVTGPFAIVPPRPFRPDPRGVTIVRS